MINNVTFSMTPFGDAQFSGDLFQFATFLAQHLQGILDQTVFTGQNGGSEPTTDVGLWFNQTYWEYWNTVFGKYLPLNVVFGYYDGTTLFNSNLIQDTPGDFLFQLPQKSGRLALDAGAGGSGTQAGTNVNIDWSTPSLYLSAAGNLTVVDPGLSSDLTSFDLWVETPPSTAVAFTITFPNHWRKFNPVLSTTDSSHRSVDHFRITQIGVDIFAEKIGTFLIDTSGGGGPTVGGNDTTPPTFVKSYSQNGNIIVEFSELLLGTTTSGSWLVNKTGVSQGIASMQVNGNKVTIFMSSAISVNDSVTVQMLASSGVKDLAGNNAVAFGPGIVNTASG